MPGGGSSWVVCGDMNVEPDTVVRLVLGRGFDCAYRGVANAFTCNTNRRAKKIDYIFFTAGLSAVPSPLPATGDDTPLPSDQEPSDHLPLRAELTCYSGGT